MQERRTRFQLKKKWLVIKCGGTECRLGHFRRMLTSKLATAGRQGTINSHNKKKKVGADHVVSAM